MFSEETRSRWGQGLVTLNLPVGAVLGSAGMPIRYVYFPIDAVVGQFHEASTGLDMAMLLTGNEGFVGTSGTLSCAASMSACVVLKPGRVVRLCVHQLRSEMDRDSAVRHLVMARVHEKIVKLAQVALCNRFHEVEQQLCLRLGKLFGDSPEDELPITQELLARIVGARRERVNQIIGELQRAGILEASRGRLRIFDRKALISRTCECRKILLREWG
jgi:CRP-like cAMP-binding protein